MTKLQTSLVAEETWVDGAAEKLASLPTATSAYELDVSISFVPIHRQNHIEIFLSFKIFIVRKHKYFLDFRNHFAHYVLHITFFLSFTRIPTLLFDICFVSMNLCVNTTFIDLSNLVLYI